MATRYIGSTSERPRGVGDIVGASSGGTLSGSQTVQVVFDDAIFTSSAEGKERLETALRAIADRIRSARIWPITSAS